MAEANLENRPLVLDLVEWIAEQPRPHDDVMAAWRTSCPRLTIWEDALDERLVSVSLKDGLGKIVRVTDAGNDFLRQYGRGAAAPDV